MLKSFFTAMVMGVLVWSAVSPAGAESAEDSGRSSGKSAMEWRMLPGESLNSLAALFYPKDRRMQQRFVAATIALNRERLQNLAPEQVFDEATSLEIPSLHALSYQAGKPRKRAAAMRKPVMPAKPAAQDAGSNAPVSKDQKAAYEALEKRAEQRRQELEKLSQRLKSLEESSQAMQQSLKASSQPVEEAQGRRLKRVGP